MNFVQNFISALTIKVQLGKYGFYDEDSSDSEILQFERRPRGRAYSEMSQFDMFKEVRDDERTCQSEWDVVHPDDRAGCHPRFIDIDELLKLDNEQFKEQNKNDRSE